MRIEKERVEKLCEYRRGASKVGEGREEVLVEKECE